MSTNNADVIAMLVLSALGSMWLGWPMGKELGAFVVDRLRRRRIRREQVAWNEQRTARMRDVLR